MRTLGTIDEWIESGKDVWLTNRNFLQAGVAIHNPKKIKPTKFTYPTGRAGGSDPMIYFGPQCPYIEQGTFQYQAGVICYWGSGGSVFPLSDRMAQDPNWEPYELADYQKDERMKR